MVSVASALPLGRLMPPRAAPYLGHLPIAVTWTKLGPGHGHGDALQLLRAPTANVVDAFTLGTGGTVTVQFAAAPTRVFVLENEITNAAGRPLNPEPFEVLVLGEDNAWISLGTSSSERTEHAFDVPSGVAVKPYVTVRDLGGSAAPNGAPCSGADIRCISALA
jgi:hypothetical protein